MLIAANYHIVKKKETAFCSSIKQIIVHDFTIYLTS